MDLASLDLGEFGKQLFLRLLEQTSTDGKLIDILSGRRLNLIYRLILRAL